jgi:hypothetical protein
MARPSRRAAGRWPANQAVVSDSSAIESANFIGLTQTLAPRRIRSSMPQAIAIGSMSANSSAPNAARRGSRNRNSAGQRRNPRAIVGRLDVAGSRVSAVMVDCSEGIEE